MPFDSEREVKDLLHKALETLSSAPTHHRASSAHYQAIGATIWLLQEALKKMRTT